MGFSDGQVLAGVSADIPVIIRLREHAVRKNTDRAGQHNKQ